MVEFSKIMDRGKSAGPGQGGKAASRGGLNLRKLSKRPQRQDSAGWDQEVATREKQALVEKRKALYNQATGYLGLVLSTVQAGRAFSLEPGLKIIEKIVDAPASDDPLFLQSIHTENGYDLTVAPSVNVAIYAIKMAENLGFSKNRQVEIGMAGLLHDIGMARIPEEIINKQELTHDEVAVFKERPGYGYEILKTFRKGHAYLAECALQVHERIDGSGYPGGLQGDEINEYAQIIGLVDVYEALIHPRPQREKLLHFYAVKEIIKTGKGKFQRRYLKAWLNTFSIFPLNSYVRLNSGAVGRVIRTDPDQPLRPEIQVIYDSLNKRVLTERFINLSEHSLLYIVDSVSEEDLVEIGEASYLVARPGRGQAGITESEIEPETDAETGSEHLVDADTGSDNDTDLDSQPEDIGDPDVPVDEAPAPRLTEARAAKPENRKSRKLLLILAILLLVAGLVWQLQASTFVENSGPDQVVVNTRLSEEAKPDSLDKKAALPAKAAPAVKKTVRLPAKTESAKPAQLSTEEVSRTAKRDSQKRETVAARQATPDVQVAMESKPGAPDEPEQLSASVKKGTPAKKQAVFITPPQSGRYPYSILLASFTKLSEAKTAIARYRGMGLDPFWVKVDLGEKGQWFRVFNGYYSDRALALEDIERYSLKSALVKPTRFAAWVAGFRDNQTLAEKRSELEDMGFSTYVTPGSLGARQLFIGAFYTMAGAQTQQADLASAGIASRIVER